MENKQVEELGQSITKRLQSAIISLLRDYHLFWKVDGNTTYNISGIKRD